MATIVQYNSMKEWLKIQAHAYSYSPSSWRVEINHRELASEEWVLLSTEGFCEEKATCSSVEMCESSIKPHFFFPNSVAVISICLVLSLKTGFAAIFFATNKIGDDKDEIRHKRLYPRDLACCWGHSSLFCFCTRSWDSSLFLTFLRDKTVT